MTTSLSNQDSVGGRAGGGISTRVTVALLSAFSALLIGVIFVTAPSSPEKFESGVWYAALFASPYLIAAAIFVSSQKPAASAWSFARGLAITATVGIVSALLFMAAGMPLMLGMFVLGVQSSAAKPLIDLAAAAMRLPNALGPAGLGTVILLLIAQFPLSSVANRGRQAVAHAASPRAAWGVAVGIVPFFVAMLLVHAGHRTELGQVRASQAEQAKRDSAERFASEGRGFEAQDVARKRLQTCPDSACRDSLIASIKRDGLAALYTPKPDGGFTAVIAADRDVKDRYITDQTGIMLLWRTDGEPFETPSWNSHIQMADYSFPQLFAKFRCLADNFQDSWKGSYPAHLRREDDCGLMADTTDLMLYRGYYRIVYSAGKANAHNRITTFSLTARPQSYGQPAVRSYLLTQDSVAHVTVMDRPARPTDPVVHRCERGDHCEFPPR